VPPPIATTRNERIELSSVAGANSNGSGFSTAVFVDGTDITDAQNRR